MAGDDMASLQHRWPATRLHCSTGSRRRGLHCSTGGDDESFIVALVAVTRPSLHHRRRRLHRSTGDRRRGLHRSTGDLMMSHPIRHTT